MKGKYSVVWFVVFVLVVALAGGAGGVLVDRYAMRQARSDRDPAWVRAPRMQPPPGNVGPMGGRRPGWLGERLQRQLNLTEAQRGQLRTILERRGARVEELRGQLRDQLRAEQDALRAEISGILDEQQRERFERMVLQPPGPPQRGQRR